MSDLFKFTVAHVNWVEQIESARLTSAVFSNSDTGKTGSGVDVVVDTHALVRSNRLTIYSIRLLH